MTPTCQAAIYNEDTLCTKAVLPGKAKQTCMGTGVWGCARTRLIMYGALEFNGGELQVLGLKISERKQYIRR